MKTIAALLAALIAMLPLAAGAQTSYRCVGKDGKKYYGSAVPPACLGQPVEQLNSQGMVVKRFDAAASAAEREKKAAEEEERKKREAISKEEGRRNRALLATYTSEKDIDQARARALTENEGAVKEIEARIGALSHPRRVERAAALIRVKVDVEVFGLNRLEIEAAVLDLILAEVLPGGRLRSRAQHRKQTQTSYRASHTSLTFRPLSACVAGGDHRGIPPQPLELIKVPQLGMKQVDHEVYVIEQHPAALL